ncbi:MAG: Rossmann-like and DUF2520 domain-containing protein [Campylobacterota bacterium]|nr:Rossmann-like and DUF2520 domain-containing protein [Campylobacterota bacterium]
MQKKVKLSIIGAGKVGTTIAILAARTGKYEVYLASRSQQAPKETQGEKLSFTSIDKALIEAEIILLSIVDDAIASFAKALANKKLIQSGVVVAHCSGALSSDSLNSLQKQSKLFVASMHPLQTFPNIASSLKRIEGTYCYYEGDPQAKVAIAQLAKDLGMHPIEIEKEAKSLYHASAVVACNYLCALMDGALDLGEAAGIDRQTMWRSLDPLITATLDNIRTTSPANALTGPIARGDKETIKRHLKAIEKFTDKSSDLKMLYSTMGLQSSHLALKKGSIDKSDKSMLDEILKDSIVLGR